MLLSTAQYHSKHERPHSFWRFHSLRIFKNLQHFSFYQICVSPLMSGEVCQFGLRHSSVLGAQWVPGSVRQLSEHQRRAVGHVAQHPPGSAGEQHGPQRGTMFQLQLCSVVCNHPERFFLYCYAGNECHPLRSPVSKYMLFCSEIVSKRRMLLLFHVLSRNGTGL